MTSTSSPQRQRPRLPPAEHQERHQCLLLPPPQLHVKRKKFRIVIGVYKLADSDTENVRDLNAKECLNDSLKSNYNNNVLVPKGEGSTATW